MQMPYARLSPEVKHRTTPDPPLATPLVLSAAARSPTMTMATVVVVGADSAVRMTEVRVLSPTAESVVVGAALAIRSIELRWSWAAGFPTRSPSPAAPGPGAWPTAVGVLPAAGLVAALAGLVLLRYSWRRGTLCAFRSHVHQRDSAVHFSALNLWLDGSRKGSPTLNDRGVSSCGIGGRPCHGLALMAGGRVKLPEPERRGRGAKPARRRQPATASPRRGNRQPPHACFGSRE